ncbi:MAG TPA: carboxypeptidase-like regulatory domain-containing protein [Acidobacteriaceae bacterium]|nr:carboxypeptidase-like regulatory domain-containing protein [Acidobacteriaceae bacterium]
MRRVIQGVFVLCIGAWLAVSAVASEYRGQVTFNGMGLPGSTVTVTATQGDKKVVAVSDDQGLFNFPDLADGKWTLTVQMTGFAALKQEITVAPSAPAAALELKLLSLDEIRAEDKPLKVDATQLAAAAAAAAPGAGGAAPAAGIAAAKSEGILINGSHSNAATSQFSMNQAFGNNRNRRSLYNGSVSLQLENSALDAAPYSLTGTPAVKPQFNNYTLRGDFGGPLNIKRLMPRGPYFGLFYTHSQNNNYRTQTALVPTGQDSSGNWTLTGGPIFVPAQFTQPGITSPACLAALPGATQTDAVTGKQIFTNNIIPKACVASASTALLAPYQPLVPNVVGDPAYNYQAPVNSSSAADTLGLRLNKGIGKNYFYGNWNFSDSRNTNPSIFGFTDTGASLGINANVNWSRSFTQRLRSTLGYTFGRSRSSTNPYYAYQPNFETAAGIQGADTEKGYGGPPTLNFGSGILGLSDGVLAYNRNESNGITEGLTWSRGRHNVAFGGAFNRLEFNYKTQTNPNGSFRFTGAATQASVTSGGTTAPRGGSDFADFLLGLPDTSAIAYGNADKYLRQNTYNIYVNDDFRVNPEFSINAGVSWEYGSPVSERNGKLVNLSIAPNFGTATAVTGSNPLLHADYSRPEPKVAIAWRPISGSSLLIRSSYGINTDTSVYQQAAYEMAQQAPLSTSLSLSNSPGCAFNIANPFTASSCSTTTPDTFALDPNFRVGYVQTWTLQVQRDLPFSMQMLVNYDGIKGTHGVQEFLPNTCAPVAGSTITSCPQYGNNTHGYIYRTSGGNLEREEGWINLRRRPRSGFEAGLTYTFAKSIDDFYSLSGQGGVTSDANIVQDWTNPRGQRGLSSGDQRHKVVAYAQYTTGLGLGGKALLSGWRGAIYKDWSIRADFSAGSGLPETPIYAGATIVGAAYGTIRPDIVGSPYANPASGYFLNSSAYAVPTGHFGSARRNSIEGPNTFSLNAQMNRTFRLHGRYSMDASLTAANVLNHVVIPGWNMNWTPQSRTFGSPLQPASMRTVTVNLRMRF